MCLYSFVPCFMLYNSFHPSEALGYSITLIVFLGICFSACLYQLIVQDKIRRIEAYLLQDGSKKFSKMFFNSPDWTLSEKGSGIDSRMQITISLQNLILEDRVIDLIKQRTNAKKIQLIVVRLLLFTLNISLLGASWYAIFLVNVNEYTISSYLAAHYSWLSYLSAFIPSICLTLINTLIPLLTNLIIYFERWDYHSTVINNQIWRNFLAKEINIVIFFFLNINMLVPIGIL